jgi:mRNA-degrading endonuclease RelE of RelBE toxin-antitoxin system
MNQKFKNIDKLVKHMFDILLTQLHTTLLKSSSEPAEENFKRNQGKNTYKQVSRQLWYRIILLVKRFKVKYWDIINTMLKKFCWKYQ